MYVNTDTIIKAAALLGAVCAICAFTYKIIKWFQAQEEQSKDIEELREKQRKEIQAIKNEQCLLTYGILACLKGLKEQGCNGPVTEAISKFEKHLNQSAHGQQSEVV